MKARITIAIVFLILGFIVGLIVGWRAGWGYTIPAVELAVKTGMLSPDKEVGNHWFATSRARLFGKYFVFKPSNTKSAALWVCTGQRPYYPLAMLEDGKLTGQPDQLSLSDCDQNSVNVTCKDGRFASLFLFKGQLMMTDFDMDGVWDLRDSGSSSSKKREARIGSEWLELVKKDNRIFVNTKDGLREIARDKGGYYFVDKTESNKASEAIAPQGGAQPQR